MPCICAKLVSTKMLEELFISNCYQQTERGKRKLQGTALVSAVLVKSAKSVHFFNGIEWWK